jgi:hypothetical protein
VSKGQGVPVGNNSGWYMERAGLKSFPCLPQQGAGLGTNASLAQMVSGLVGQLLMQPVLVGESSFFPTSNLRDFHDSQVWSSVPSLLTGTS